MDLFVINRHMGGDETHVRTEEHKKLAKIMKNIEKRKKQRMQQRLKIVEKSKLRSSKNSPPLATDPSVKQTIDIDIKEPEKEILPEPTDSSGNLESFTILGTDKFDKKIKVKRVLPKWLLHPTVISGNLQTGLIRVKDIKDLDSDLKKKLAKNGIKNFFPVQSKVIPFLLKSNTYAKLITPQDICVSAPTGSGKTLAFIIPILQNIKDRSCKTIRALVILPTQSLAIQICQAFKLYSEGLGLNIGLITGSCPLQDEQKKLMAYNSVWGYTSKVDVLICTAGRLVDHLKSTKGFNLKHLEFLVIDEADRVLDNVQDDWLYHLENHLKYEDSKSNMDSVVCNNKLSVLNSLNVKKKRPPQKLLFSATLSQDPEKLQKLSLFQPKLFTSVVNGEIDSDTENKMEVVQNSFIGKYTMPSELTEKYIVCSLATKPLVLYKYIKDNNLTKIMVFTNTVESVHRLKVLLKLLYPEFKIREVSSKLSLKKRKALMQSFTNGSIDILVCTDSMARGIDLPNVNAVISYTAPNHLKTYIHRVGRTARAGEKGVAITLLQPNQKEAFLGMLMEADKSNLEMIDFDEDDICSLSNKYEIALEELKKQIENETQNNKLKVKKEKGLLKRNMKRKRTLKNKPLE